MISNREITIRLLISKSLVRNILKTFIATGGIQHHSVYRMLKKTLLFIYLMLIRLSKERISWSTNNWKQVVFGDKIKFEVINRKSKVLFKRYKSENYLLIFYFITTLNNILKCNFMLSITLWCKIYFRAIFFENKTKI